ncbi:hypothetical protein LX87_00140 [Larkinella arboricola]|uniref:Outer membrane protein n=1 Tax=Larkinella arboricola TaxID=643671 RepID=A0A327XCM2_LARAB|nr:hypothetical protein [Larkinella arboricola]RAK02026.1 hypothetical protein LX87_00140 [Larkinella arboricola]
MKKILLNVVVSLAIVGFAQTASVSASVVDFSTTVRSAFQANTDSTVALLDKAVAANAKGDKAGTVQALQASTTALEAEAKSSTGSLKDKLVGQVSNLKKLIPLAQAGLLKGNMLQKAVSLAKTALGANQIEKLIGSGNLISKVSGLTKNLNLVKTGLSVVGGSTASSGNSLINTALGSLSKLGKGGAVAKAAEPAVKSQLNSVLGLVKGIL